MGEVHFVAGRDGKIVPMKLQVGNMTARQTRWFTDLGECAEFMAEHAGEQGREEWHIETEIVEVTVEEPKPRARRKAAAPPDPPPGPDAEDQASLFG